MDTLHAGESLSVDQQLESRNGRYRLRMQGDGNLVLYEGTPSAATAVWATDTWALANERRPVRADMQQDGNFVLYSAEGAPAWASETHGHDGSTLVLQDDRNVVIYDAADQPLWASDTWVSAPAKASKRVAFTPREHGFKFANTFVNHLITVPALNLDIATRGRCGGMAAAALDYWHHGLAVPQDPNLPADGSLLADYIYGRLVNTMVANGFKFFHFMRTPDHPTWVNGIGVARATREEEYPRVKASVDSGRPCLLGLTQSRALGELGSDHQVVAYGYDSDDRYSYVYVYDNNHPDAEATLRFTTGYDPGEREVVQSTGEVWRGFFPEVYAPVVPWFLAEGKLLSERSDPAIDVVRGGGRFHIPSPAEFEAGGFAWSEVVEAQDGSLAHVSTYPADRTLIRERSSPGVYVTFGGRPFHIPSPEVFTSLGFDWNSVRIIPDGSLARLPGTPREGTLLRTQNDPPVYVVEGGKLRHVPSMDVFEARGFVWEDVGIVPDGALDALSKGTPLESTQPDPPPVPRSWAERPSGTLHSSAGDRIAYAITAGAKPADEVEFVLALGTGLTWRKELVLEADDGQWTIAVQDATRRDQNGLYRSQLPNGHLRFRKARMFGIVEDVHGLGNLDQLPGGAQVTFTWMQD